MSTAALPPTRPYLLRAIYDWAQDNHLTPYLVVNAEEPNVLVPRQHVKDGQITLNIAAHATHQLVIEQDAIHFSARFGGVSQQLYIPMRAVLGLYARENGHGLFFDPQEYGELEASSSTVTDSHPSDDSATAPAKKPSLRILD
jgi:stringent starvation protein B